MTRPTINRCNAQVSEPPHYIHTHRCIRKAEDGPWQGVYLCWQHLKHLDRYGFVRLYDRTTLKNREGQMVVEP